LPRLHKSLLHDVRWVELGREPLVYLVPREEPEPSLVLHQPARSLAGGKTKRWVAARISHGATTLAGSKPAPRWWRRGSGDKRTLPGRRQGPLPRCCGAGAAFSKSTSRRSPRQSRSPRPTTPGIRLERTPRTSSSSRIVPRGALATAAVRPPHPPPP